MKLFGFRKHAVRVACSTVSQSRLLPRVSPCAIPRIRPRQRSASPTVNGRPSSALSRLVNSTSGHESVAETVGVPYNNGTPTFNFKRCDQNYRMKQKDKWNVFYSSKKREPFLHLTEEQVDNILKKFPNAASALDIGCGEGQLLIQLEERGISATGIDISDIGINEAKKRVSGSLIVGDFEQFSFPDTTSFDLVFVKFVIAFIQNPETFFKKIDSLLKTDGGFILLTPVIRESDSSSQKEEVFIEQSILDEYLPRYFSKIEETILYSEGHKRLVLYTCTKK